jgi:hypothetical protein
MKPQIIRAAAERHPGKPLLFLDADCWIRRASPWLEGDRGELALWTLDPRTLPKGRFIQRHKYQGLRRGSLWAGGRLLFRPGAMMGQILDEWEKVNLERCNDWGDQLHLQIACSRLGVEGVAMPDYVVAALAHCSGFHRGLKRTPKAQRDVPERKVVLLGSAPSVVKWWKRTRGWYMREGFSVVAINNAWRVPSLDELDIWMHPLDFSGPEPPAEIPRNSTIGYREMGYPVGREFSNWVIGPYWLRGVRLTVTDALVSMLNEAVADGVRLTMHVAGNDMVYPTDGKRTHFYGVGQPDPLRYRSAELDTALLQVQAFYRDAGAVLLNVSGQAETRLPFERMEVAA